MRNAGKSFRGGLLYAVAAAGGAWLGGFLGLGESETLLLIGGAVFVLNYGYRELRARWPLLEGLDPILIGSEAARLASIKVTLELTDGTTQEVHFGVGVESIQVPVNASVSRLELKAA